MNIRHRRRLGTFEENDRPMGTAGKRRRLRKEPSIGKRRREISICLAFNHDAAIDAVVTDIEALHPDIEIGARSREI